MKNKMNRIILTFGILFILSFSLLSVSYAGDINAGDLPFNGEPDEKYIIKLPWWKQLFSLFTIVDGKLCSASPDKSGDFSGSSELFFNLYDCGGNNCVIQLWNQDGTLVPCSGSSCHEPQGTYGYDAEVWLCSTSYTDCTSEYTYTGLDSSKTYHWDIYLCTEQECSCTLFQDKGCGYNVYCDNLGRQATENDWVRERTCSGTNCADYETTYCYENDERCIPTPECPTKPSVGSWSDSANQCGTRTNYKCDASTNFKWVSYTETKTCLIEEQPNIEVVSTSITKVGDGNQVQGIIGLRNTGESMTENWIVELQVVPSTVGLMALVQVPNYQANCNPDTIANVHTQFKLNSGQTTTITLISPQRGILKDGTYDTGFFVVKKCFSDAPTEDRTVPGVIGVQGQLKISISTGSKEICGNEVCEEGEEGICLSDCKVECNLDNVCDGIESCTECADCINLNNPGTDRCIVPPEDRCANPRDKFSLDCKESGIPIIGFFACKLLDTQINIIAGKECSESLTEEEFKKANDDTLLSTVCVDSRNCATRDGYTVECVRQEVVGISVPTHLFTKLGEIFGGQPTKGVCLATPVEKPGVDFNKEYCISTFCLKLWQWLIGVIVLLFIFVIVGSKK